MKLESKQKTSVERELCVSFAIISIVQGYNHIPFEGSMLCLLPEA